MQSSCKPCVTSGADLCQRVMAPMCRGTHGAYQQWPAHTMHHFTVQGAAGLLHLATIVAGSPLPSSQICMQTGARIAGQPPLGCYDFHFRRDLFSGVHESSVEVQNFVWIRLIALSRCASKCLSIAKKDVGCNIYPATMSAGVLLRTLEMDWPATRGAWAAKGSASSCLSAA